MQCDLQRTYDAEVICLEISAVEVCALAVAVKVSRLDPAELVVAAFAGFRVCEALVQFDLRRTYDAEVICLEIPTVEVCAFAVAVEVSKLDPTELVVAAFADHGESRSLGFCGGRKIPRWAIQRC